MDLERRMEAVESQIYGKNGEPGMRIRLDRIEQTMKQFVWVMKSIAGGVAVLILKAGIELLYITKVRP